MSACGKKYAAYLEMCFSNFLEPSTHKKLIFSDLIEIKFR